MEWGLGPYFEGKVVEPDSITFRRWQNGSAIGFTKLIPEFRAKYHGPYYVVHRAHFHDALHRRALDLGIEVKTAHRVVAFGDEEAYVMCEDGTKVSGDLIVAADGKLLSCQWLSLAHSIIRHQIESPRMYSWRGGKQACAYWLRSLQGDC